MSGFVGISYKERLGKDQLFILEDWRLRGDLMEVFKIMRGIKKVVRIFFPGGNVKY